MSCGDPHDVDCRQILDALDSYLDGEDTSVDRALIAQHLQECGPCLQEHHIEQLVKARLARACGGEACSDEVRTRIVARIREVRVASVGGTVRATETSVTATVERD
jgi:mycothiol system anti-sigma-R factor